jgi:predicted nucleic acid-binding protein
VIAVDTSVVVAAFASWHEGHASALSALARRPRLPAHVALESFSVLTRLPPPHRARAGVVSDFLAAAFPGVPLALPAKAHLDLVTAVARSGFAGGAIYDALVGATAKRAGATLLTRDRRALTVYEALGVRHELLG